MGRETRNRYINADFDRVLRARSKTHLRGRLIDIGCGEKPYASIVAPYVDEHIGVDHAGTLHSLSRTDLVGSGYALPCPDESFDSALCTAVLEHMEEPGLALLECLRVLKPGGVAIYSVPLFWHLHEEPRDFYRYTRFGLEYLFGKAGFEILEILPLSGFWITWGQMLANYIDRANRGLLRRAHIIDAVTLWIQVCTRVLERADTARGWTYAYLVVARKPFPDVTRREGGPK